MHVWKTFQIFQQIFTTFLIPNYSLQTFDFMCRCDGNHDSTHFFAICAIEFLSIFRHVQEWYVGILIWAFISDFWKINISSNDGWRLIINSQSSVKLPLFHWGRVTHIVVSKLSIIGSDNGLSPGRQAIIWTNAGILLIGPLGTNFSEILSNIHKFSVKKMHLKMLSAKWRPFCLGLNMLIFAGSWSRD